MLLGMLGAMISEWKTRFDYRVWLLLPIASFLGLWAFTPTIFWPMINEYYGGATGKIVKTDVEWIHLAHRWIVFDGCRVAGIALGFLSSIRAISIPYPKLS